MEGLCNSREQVCRNSPFCILLACMLHPFTDLDQQFQAPQNPEPVASVVVCNGHSEYILHHEIRYGIGFDSAVRSADYSLRDSITAQYNRCFSFDPFILWA